MNKCYNKIFFALILGVMALLFSPQETYAIDETDIMKKVLANGINYCYSNNFVEQQINGQAFSITSTIKNKGTIIVPPTYGTSLTCRQAFGGNKGLNAIYSKTPSSPTDLGYVLSNNASTDTSEKCAYIEYRYEGTSKRTNSVCFEVDNDGNYIDPWGAPTIKNDGSGPLSLIYNGNYGVTLYDSDHVDMVNMEIYYGDKWSTLENNLKSTSDYIASVMVPNPKDPNGQYINVFFDANIKTDSTSAEHYQDFVITDFSVASLAALKFYTGKTSFDAVKFTTAEVKYMWRNAFDLMVADGVITPKMEGCHAGKEDAEKETSAGYIYFNQDNNMWCPVDINNRTATYRVIEKDMTRLMLATPEQILDAMKTENAGYTTDKQACIDKAETARREAQNLLNQSTTSQEYRDKAKKLIEELDDILQSKGDYWYEDNGAIFCYAFTDLSGQVTGGAVSGSNTPTGGANLPEAEVDECQGVAGSLGWILCPVLKMVSEGVDNIYDNFIQQQFLEVDSAKLNPNTTEGLRVYTAWGLMRNIANVIFVILFMIVLFSQFTGIGLTNYGIKKMLPKLIMVAILVNISFLLCQFAVDVSNILGYSLNSMFDSLSGTITGIGGSFNGSSTLANWINTLGLIVGVLSIGSWLPAFLLVLLSAAISVFFGAIILGARLAGVYILVVLAPAAIVCYALPNSKKLFDRWFKIFTSLLLVFPICGALMGGGNFASSILLGDDPYTNPNVFLILVAMLLRVVPFFLIPGLVRSSMAALGNVGAKISSIGSRFGGNVTGAARKSDGFQRFAEFGEQARARGVNLRHKAYGKLTGGRFTGRKSSKRRIARAISTQEARIRGDAKAGAIASGGFISRGRRDDIMSSALEAEEAQGVKDADNGYKLDENFDANNASTVSAELEHRLNELQKKPDNVEVRRKVKALTKILLESDDGRGALTETVQKFAEANPSSKATSILGRYLGNSENMGVIKGKNQRGLQKLVQDINSGAGINSLAKYNAMGAGKIGAGAVGGLDESFLKAQVKAARSGAMSAADLQKFADTYTRALTSENAANEIPPELVGYLNDIRELANPGSTPLQPGEMLPIPHATMPTGWTYNNAAQRWEDGHGGALSREDAIKAEEIAKHNARADIDNP